MLRSYLLLLGVLTWSGCSPAYSEAFRREAAKQTLVSLTVQPLAKPVEQGPASNGTAIIVGADQSHLYLITAEHVIPEEVMDVTLKSVLWGAREVAARVVRRHLATDLALFTIPRQSIRSAYKLEEPFWNVLAPNDFDAHSGNKVFLLGRQHGLKLSDPLFAEVSPARQARNGSLTKTSPGDAAQLQVSSEQDSSLDRFTMITTTPPASGDSGGGVFNDRWQLIGVHAGNESAFEAYRFDRALQYVRRSEFATEHKVRLKPMPERPSQVVTWIGVGLLVTSAAFALAAYQQREAYYEDASHGDALVKPFNITADCAAVAGIALLGVQLYFLLYDRHVESSARERWK